MNRDYPCKICSHDYGAHEPQITDPLNMIGCIRCYNLSKDGLAPWVFYYHNFIPDNLKYLELKFETCKRGTSSQA